MKTKYVAYYRVSTQRQGASGLGLDAQRAQITNCTAGGEIVAEFTDIESGKNSNRVQLTAAIEYCKKNRCELIIAKLDRLSRDVKFIFELKGSGVKFRACDLPDFNTLTLGIFASLAQYERELISERTSAALRAKMKREGGKWWGKINSTAQGRAKGIETIKYKAASNERNIRARAHAAELRAKGKTLQAICDSLNASAFYTSKGTKFWPIQVSRLLS